MDTKFWGPSGWKLLHLITFMYEPSRKTAVKSLFVSLPYVLPCKFCRASLHGFMEEDPIEPHLDNSTSLSRWLYRIHNQVNDKLRNQGLLTEPNPPFSVVESEYKARIAKGCTRTEFQGWDFLFSIAENHPYSKVALHSKPMPNCPYPAPKGLTKVMKNKYNILDTEERIQEYAKFWKSLGPSLPFEEWRKVWSQCEEVHECIQGRAHWLRYLWKIRCCMEKSLDLLNRETFGFVCKRLARHRSGCGGKKAKTCRKERKRSTT